MDQREGSFDGLISIRTREGLAAIEMSPEVGMHEESFVIDNVLGKVRIVRARVFCNGYDEMIF